MVIKFKELVELIGIISWPLVVTLAFAIFREPLARFLESIGQRATKLSAFQISVELATVPSPQVPWSDPSLPGSADLAGGAVTSTTIMELFRRIRDDAAWHYLIVDIESGERWLISRLFLFTVVFQYMRGLRCVAFVQTKENRYREFIGLAKPEDVRRVLSKNYYWLEPAFLKACTDNDFTGLAGPLSKETAEKIVNSFLGNDQIQRRQDPQNPAAWEQLGKQALWEHTKWLTKKRFDDELREAVYDRDDSHVVDSPDTAANARNQAIVRRQAPFVALVNKGGEFKRLIDRQALLNQVARRLAEP